MPDREVEPAPDEPAGLASEDDATPLSTNGLEPDIAEAILNLLVDGGIPSDEFGTHPASIALLQPAAALAVGLIVWHGKQCRRPKTCQDTPPPLRNFLTMREPTIARQLDTIARSLIQFPEFTMVRHTRDEWLGWLKEGAKEEDAALIALIESGEIFKRDNLLSYLSTDPPAKASILGTTLWARGFDEEREYALFRLLGALVLATDRGPTEAPADSEAPKPRRDRKARKEERRETKQLTDELKEARRERRRLLDDLGNETRRREELTSALEAADAELVDLRTRLEQAERDLRMAKGRITNLERDVDRGAAATGKLREAIESTEEARKELERGRNRVVRELSMKNRQVDALQAEIAAIPAGADAVHRFLEAEDARIAEARTILQGADRARADDEHAAHRKLEQAFRAAYPSYIPPRPVSVPTHAALEFEVLGGGDEVGRSSYLLHIDGYPILIDCGIKIGRKHLEEAVPDLTGIDRLGAVVLTHAHTDHLGWLPAVVRTFPDVSIYCTHETVDLAPIMLDDCYRHHAVNMHRLRIEQEHAAVPESIPDTYERDDVEEVEFRLFGCDYGEKVTLPSSEIQIRFLRSGHILGAASALIEGGGRRVLFSGDISSEPQLTVGTADWSDASDGDLDLLVLESTYGGVNRDPLHQAQEELVAFLSRVLADGGSVILPCFGLGRGQEVAMVIAQAMQNGDLPRVTVWIDGMIRSVNRVYRDHQPQFVLPDNFVEVEAAYERTDVVDQASREPILIVTTSGMLAGGPAVEYAQKLLPNPKNRIAFTGYQDEGNPGHELLRLTDGGTGIRVVTVAGEEGEPVEIRAAAPARKFGLSAHADQKGLVSYARSVRPRHIALVHGFAQTQEPLRAQLLLASPQTEISRGVHRVSL